MFQSYGITEYPNTFKRQGSFPLDKSSKFTNLDEAIEYAKSNPIAYEGQIISIVENENIIIRVLKKSKSNNTNYELVPINSYTIDINDTLININNLINNKIGIWTISEKSNKSEAVLDFDILYPLEANAYEVFFNNESVSEMLQIGDEFITSLENFKDDSIIITIKFYNNEDLAFELEAKPLYKNKVVILGTLYLLNYVNNEVT